MLWVCFSSAGTGVEEWMNNSKYQSILAQNLLQKEEFHFSVWQLKTQLPVSKEMVSPKQENGFAKSSPYLIQTNLILTQINWVLWSNLASNKY